MRCLPITAGHMIRMLILATWAFALGCAGGTDVGNPEMSSFASDTALEDYLVSQHAKIAMPMARQSVAEDMPPGWVVPDAGKEISVDMDTAAWKMDADAPDRVVAGNGCLYVAGENEVRIISALRPEDMQLIGRIMVKGCVDALHLNRERLVVLYSPEGEEEAIRGANDDENPESTLERNMERIDTGLPDGFPTETRVGILVADVRLPDNPTIDYHIQADGYRLASRISGGFLHVAARFMPDLPPLQLWHDGTESGSAEARDYNAHALADLTTDDLTPSYTAFDGFGNPVSHGRLITTQNYIRPAEPGGGAILSVISINIDAPGPDFSSIGLIADIHHVHVSSDAFYLLARVYDDHTADIYQTRIHQIDIAGDAAQYAAYGRVRGRLLDPSAVGRYQDVLRIGTITGLFQDDTADGHIFCLKKENDALTIIGRLENPFSDRTPGLTRFIGPRGFITNGEDIDRITIIDLADPASPQKAGVMQTQGLISGLFPVLDDLLMVVAQNACKVEGGPDPGPGLCFFVFDISDTSAPRLRHTETINGSGTDDSIIFRLSAPPLCRPEDRLLAVPVTIDYDRQSLANAEMNGPHLFSGLYLYQLSDAGILEWTGRLELWPGMTPDMTIDEDDPPPWIRGVLTDDAVYAVAPNRVSAGSINRMGDGFIIHSRFTLLLER
ncbi:MAG: hypothetical protein C4548_16250 [Desulfobacteraceae bacterium]|nr:MAG: hypothetical protein C4548_16250 [Desulfobacteraceae bacterium]